MNTYIEPAREIPVAAEVDVAVVGGGPSGLTAAILAARQGARVLLIERYGYLGGMATGGLVITIPTEDGFGPFMLEIIDRLRREDAVGDVVTQSDPAKHVAWFQRCTGAGTTAADGDVLHAHHQALAFHIGETHIERIGQTVLGVAI